MNADDVARARYSIKLRDGREIQLVATYQRATYAGLLEGHPTEALNAELVSGVVGVAPGGDRRQNRSDDLAGVAHRPLL